jgi:hypothetical protein
MKWCNIIPEKVVREKTFSEYNLDEENIWSVSTGRNSSHFRKGKMGKFNIVNFISHSVYHQEAAGLDWPPDMRLITLGEQDSATEVDKHLRGICA